MRVNIISRDNGWGLTKDVNVMSQLLKAHGHQVFFSPFDVRNGLARGKFDINIHCELVGGRAFNAARVNILIPNPEWFEVDWLRRLRRFAVVMAKTNHTERLFTGLAQQHNAPNLRVAYTSFATPTRRLPDVKKRQHFVHVAGNSRFKNTEILIETWRVNPQLPILHIRNAYADLSDLVNGVENIEYKFGRLPESEIVQLQNSCYWHIQASKSEGFGHVIWESMSTGGIVLTTDGAPMNEIPNCLYVKPKGQTMRHHLGDLYDLQQESLLEKVNTAMTMSDAQLAKWSADSIAIHAANNAKFNELFIKEINKHG